MLAGILFLMLLRKLYVFVQVEERFGRTCRWLFERMHGVGKLMAQHHPPWYVALAVLTMAATPLLIAETQNTYGGYDYMPYAVIFTTEFMRFGCSMALFLRDVPAQARNKTLLSMTWRYAIKWAIPGFIHAVNNYLGLAGRPPAPPPPPPPNKPGPRPHAAERPSPPPTPRLSPPRHHTTTPPRHHAHSSSACVRLPLSSPATLSSSLRRAA
jgi:hypothetical protein